MGYTTNESIVRVDIFKSTGKWVENIALDMEEQYHTSIIHNALKNALEEQTKYRQYTVNTSASKAASKFAICLIPHHVHSHPITLWLE